MFDLEKEFTAVRAVESYGAIIGFVSCKRCGASVVIDPDDKSFDALSTHVEWHQELFIHFSS